MIFYILTQPFSSLAYGKRAFSCSFHCTEDLYRHRHGKKHSLISIMKTSSNLSWCSLHLDPPIRHYIHLICIWKDLLQPVLRQYHSRADIPVDFFYCFQKVRGCNRIQLGGWLIQDQKRRMHCHNSSQIQKLLLSP